MARAYRQSEWNELFKREVVKKYGHNISQASREMGYKSANQLHTELTKKREPPKPSRLMVDLNLEYVLCVVRADK